MCSPIPRARRRGAAGREAAARGPTPAEARLAGAAIAGFNGSVPLTVLAGARRAVAEVALGLALRGLRLHASTARRSRTRRRRTAR